VPHVCLSLASRGSNRADSTEFGMTLRFTTKDERRPYRPTPSPTEREGPPLAAARVSQRCFAKERYAAVKRGRRRKGLSASRAFADPIKVLQLQQKALN
jgi:hypothetical protein